MRIYSLIYSKQYHFPPGLMDSCFGALWTQFEAACFILLGMLFEGWTKTGPHTLKTLLVMSRQQVAAFASPYFFL